jgi:lipase
VQRWPGIADALVDAELAAHLMPEGDRWRYRYSRAAVVVAWSDMARTAAVPPPDIPTLLLPAARADFVDPAWVQACRRELGDRLTVTEIDAGHLLHLEQTAQVAARIGAFLGVPLDG